MPAVFIHGVPDTQRLWDPLRAHLQRRDVIALPLPGFGVPLPNGFAATKEAYVEWLTATLELLGEPVDLVGHDWGATLTQRVVSLRPDLIRTWACGSGVVDVDYVWHDLAQQWQTEGVGEQIMAALTPVAMEEGLAAAGVPRAAAREAARQIDTTMTDCILRLYRSAVDVGREWQSDIAKITRPALIMWGEDDLYAAPLFAERLAARVHGQLVLFDHCGHWWPLERPAEAATALERLWASAPAGRAD
jgi:pimeloyl-ACP methyl ester carboxylesterase